MKVRLGERSRAQLIVWSRAEAPREACGVLIGCAVGAGVRIDAVERAQNRVPKGVVDRLISIPRPSLKPMRARAPRISP